MYASTQDVHGPLATRVVWRDIGGPILARDRINARIPCARRPLRGVRH
ncbi:hypothetical protein IEO21_02606 [Rhodonia placenta]|uniref:Uncharacterized protein n=1 Tax=Rhodonia placenta TaxID=104341 RepID=A0A8H7P7L8_9APHY|nr:hypothetical protein IEO21_02606 [Postia placenta]